MDGQPDRALPPETLSDLIGVLATLTGHILAHNVDAGMLSSLARRLSLPPDQAGEREVAQALDELVQQLCSALGEDDAPTA
ncbi:hypothetical protein ASE27_10070 [Oerskovia sp. Root918]|uniref:hypothetical protein n=1 Tax=Oerskovia sp. Root918 TaxID=1736607 RepID=UPI00070139D5|nr:hypothetical protein [Oerskovia sp. Root918]KRD36792.1 hypothetical protein ASE27_10070 [Oerskovia sp. Root918]